MTNKVKISQASIVDVALAIAKESGIEMVTMANIARKLQIKSPSLYNHFSSLYEIKQEMAYKAQSLLVDYLNDQLKQTDLDKMLTEFVLAFYRFACEHPGYYEASIIALDSSLGQKALPSSELIDIIKKALHVYQLEEKALIHTIRGLRSILHGLIDLNKSGGFKLDVQIEETLIYTVNLLITGLNNLTK